MFDFYVKKLRIIDRVSPRVPVLWADNAQMGLLTQDPTLPYRTQLSSVHYKCLFAAQLNCRRSWVILDSDPQFLPLSFADFLLIFSQRNRRKMHLIFFGVFLFFFERFFFRGEGLQLTAIFCGRLQ